jgi:hypothetical protein
MTTSPLDKKAARALSAVSGVPYQRCLDAVRVLRALPDEVDIGDLGAIMADAQSQRLIGIRTEPADVIQLAELFEQCPPADGTAFAVEQPQAETRLIIPIDFGARHFLYDLALDGRLWPGGMWSFAEGDMREAVRQATHKSSPSILVRAAPADGVDLLCRRRSHSESPG